jgi:predicted metal-dependent RNase
MKKLLEKYYDGMTSEEEEILLREWLMQDDFPEEYSADKRLFLMIDSCADEPVTVPDGLYGKIERMIDEQDAACKKHQSIKHNIILWTAGMAAAVASIFYLRSLAPEEDNTIIYITDPEIAYMETAKALDKCAYVVNKCYNSMNKANEITMKVLKTNIKE